MNTLGQEAEERALDFLRQEGLILITRNWRCRSGEIDLIMQDKSAFVFVEVRQRLHQHFGGALASITTAKCRKLQKTAQIYLHTARKSNVYCRFDAILIEGPDKQLTWLKNILS